MGTTARAFTYAALFPINVVKTHLRVQTGATSRGSWQVFLKRGVEGRARGGRRGAAREREGEGGAVEREEKGEEEDAWWQQR